MSLAVIESRWWKEGNDSVRGFFDTLVSIHELDPKEYHYEMFNNEQSLKEIVPRVVRGVDALYIAAHGNEDVISGAEGLDENDITLEAFKDIIRAGVSASKLDGIYVGSCGFMDQGNANFLFQRHSNGKNVKIRWLAGYAKDIGWIESTAIDIFFWNEYINSEGTAKEKIESVARKMKKIFKHRYLCEKMGFDIFVRKKGRGSGVTSLIRNGS